MASQNDAMISSLIDYMQDHKLLMTTAESCTAGLILSEFASVPGSGSLVDCGLAVYSPQAKQRYLKIEDHIFEQYSLTSEMLSREMAIGALDNTEANVSLANTGIAGPMPADDGTPVGTVCFAWAFRTEKGDSVYCETRHFDGGRNEVRLAAARYSLEQLQRYHERSLKTPKESPEAKSAR
jgi:PncC family amidohydrolase